MICRKLNPTDLSFLRLIKITKSVIRYDLCSNLITYYIWFRNQKIGYVEILSNENHILDIEIDEEYRRKGLATFVYNYIEKDLRIRLRPSDDLLEEGELFWKNRLKRKNPKDEEFLKKVRIEKIKNKTKLISYNLYYNGDYIAGADFDSFSKIVFDVYVNSDFRRKGLGTFLYNHIEKDQKIKLKPSKVLHSDGKLFWKARLK